MTDTEDDQPTQAPGDSPRASVASSSMPETSAAPRTAPAEQRLLANRYRLDSLLGRGSMGAVWKAHDVVLGRSVAVKEVLLPPTQSDEENDVARERALREARSIAALSHPNVVTLYDVVEDDGRPWVVMELVPAKNLAEIIRDDGTLPPVEAARIGLAVLAALTSAHEVGITHRDVKPGNILVSPDGRVKLADFGISRRAEDSALTRTGLMVGSPSYIAPEVARGRAATSSADIWGLGATLQCAVEGTPPFDLGDPVATLTAVVGDDPRPAPHAGPLEPIIAKMLRKDPRDRMRPDDVRRALEDVVAARPTPPPTYAPPSGPLASATTASPAAGTSVQPQQPPGWGAPQRPGPAAAGRGGPPPNSNLATRRVDPSRLTPPGAQTGFRPSMDQAGRPNTAPHPNSGPRPNAPRPNTGPGRPTTGVAPAAHARAPQHARYQQQGTGPQPTARRGWNNPWVAGLIGLLIAVVIGAIAIVLINTAADSSGTHTPTQTTQTTPSDGQPQVRLGGENVGPAGPASIDSVLLP